MKNYTPYMYWSKTDLAEQLISLSHKVNAPREVRELISAAIASDLWDPRKEYDGCTAVQDMFHPCTSCFLHDYLWKTGQGGREADKLFHLLMRIEGMDKARARRRWLGVRIIWLTVYKWKHLAKRNVNKLEPIFEKTLQHLINTQVK